MLIKQLHTLPRCRTDDLQCLQMTTTEVLSSSSLNADKVTKGGIFFAVDKDKDYQLVYTEPGSDPMTKH
ncbi:hypothetical protein BSAF29S_03626 [Bacillus safensis subsp. safensis]